jgi:GDP-4-dehydro-6-deoxy-D-mannose reductase
VRVLVTGIGGFAGRHLAVALTTAGHEVHGVALAADAVDGALAVHRADLLDDVALGRIATDVRPEGVVHLAGVSFVPAAEADPRLAYRVNVEGTVSLLRVLDEVAPGARVLVVSSGDAYGAVAAAEVPVSEDVPLRPVSVYGASKAAAEMAARQWQRRSRCEIVIARPFNHAGPGQAADFVVPAFARQIARIAAGGQAPVVRVGDLSPVRDLSDVPTTCAAAEAYASATCWRA